MGVIIFNIFLTSIDDCEKDAHDFKHDADLRDDGMNEMKDQKNLDDGNSISCIL